MSGSDRSAVTSRPQHLLLTLLGDYWYRREEALPSAALVRVLGEFSVSVQNARAAVSRLARRGLLEPSRNGRRTFYRLTPKAADVLAEGTHRIFTFGTTPVSWDGNWTVVAFSLPEVRRDTRHVLRTRLRWLGFAPLYDGFWTAPGDRAAAAADLIAELDIESATIVVGPARGSPGGDPIRAWDLRELCGSYEGFIERFGPLRERIANGDVGTAEGLVARTTIIDVWRTYPAIDPELPGELLPDGWPRAEARQLFADVYDELGPIATTRIRQILAEYEPALASLAVHHTSREVLRGAVA